MWLVIDSCLYCSRRDIINKNFDVGGQIVVTRFIFIQKCYLNVKFGTEKFDNFLNC